MVAQTQRQYLNAVKTELIGLRGKKVTWDEFAEMCGIEPRAFKTYRMPDKSNDYRVMSKLAMDAVERVLVEQQKKAIKRVKNKFALVRIAYYNANIE